jgi:radical SAM superfamily enzyme YgiQ (UPF0313 family)
VVLMADVVLVRPGMTRKQEAHWSRVPPLGLGYLAAATRRKGITTAVVDGKLEGHQTAEATAKAIIAHNPAIVGLSILTSEYGMAAKIANILKKEDPQFIIMVGGAHVSALPEISLKHCQSLDYAFAGEAEIAFPQAVATLLRADPHIEFDGIYKRTDTGEVSGPPTRCQLPDVDLLPFPAWDLFPRTPIYPILTERGCPYQCVFCSHNLSNKVRSRSVDQVMDEIAWLNDNFSPKWIYIEDETFGLKRERTFDFLEKLARYNSHGRLRFKAQTRIDRISEPFLKLMKAAGFERLEIGIESGDPDVLAKSGKGISPDEIEPAVKLIKASGIKAWLNFIIGLPGETRGSVKNSIRLAARLNPNRLSVAIIVAYPGSQIFEWARRGMNGYRLISTDWGRFDKYLDSSVELDSMSYRTMRKFQLQMYFETYIRNHRFGDLFRLIWKNRSFVGPVLRTLNPISTRASVRKDK